MDDSAQNVDQIDMEDDSLNHFYSTRISTSHLCTRIDSYKKHSARFTDQEERRKKILKEQKNKRHNLIESIRNIHLKTVAKLGYEEQSKKPFASTPQKQLKKTTSSQFSNQLMFSEWLEEVPQDFENNWIAVVCPIGKRCLVVASEGTTCVYNKGGKLIAKHSSQLPGGKKDSKTDETIIDCVYSDLLRTYFILDCLVWKSHPIVDSETDFRFYWLKCKLDEEPSLNSSSYENPYKFRDLPRTYSSPIGIQSLFRQQFDFEVDGVLFYHKEAHYFPGVTPLVGWLKAYMLPEILNVEMPQWVLQKTPKNFEGSLNEIRQSRVEIERLQQYLENVRSENSIMRTNNNEPEV